MKSIIEFITESSNDWINDKIKELKNTNTDNKLQSITVLYGVELEYFYRAEVRNGFNQLWSWDDAKRQINTAHIVSALWIDVVSTEKGNFYGVNKNKIDNKPELAKLFNKRVKGTKGNVWTNDINNIQKYIETIVNKVKNINKIPSGDYQPWQTYIFTTKELAKDAANKLSKLHKLKIYDEWHTEKIKELKSQIESKTKSIKSYEDYITGLKNDIAELQEEIAEYETLKNVSSDDFNESLNVE